MTPFRCCFAVLATLIGAMPAGVAAQSVAAGDSLLARGDTTGAIAAYEAAVARNLHDAEAHYRAGVLRISRFSHNTNLSENRRKATEHFEYATQFAADSAKYWLAFADALRSESGITARVQVAHLVGKALEAAKKHGGGVTAEAEYRAARIYWDRSEVQSHMYHFINRAMTVDPLGIAADWQYAERFFATTVAPDADDLGLADRHEAEEHARAALVPDPMHVTDAGLLVVLLGDQNRWDEAYDLARQLGRAAPDSGRALALLGLAQARLNRWRDAQATFGRALAKMSPRERAPYDNLTVILKAADSARLAGAPHGELLGTDSVYWLASQPLFLNDVNETKVEFYARLTYVIHRWSDPLRGYQGYESDRGRVYVRYGPPDIWATLGDEAISSGRITQNILTGESEVHDDPYGILEAGSVAIAWLYHRSHLGFVFSVTPGFSKGIFTGDVGAIYAEARNNAPVRFDNVPAVRNMDTVDLQIAQFRPDSLLKTEVAVFGFMPIGRMTGTAAKLQMDLQTAAIVKDERMQDVLRQRQDARIQGGDSVQIERRTWRLPLAPRDYLLRVEARLPVLDRAARGATALNVRSFAGDTLLMSDLVLAGRLAPKDSIVRSWNDFFMEPSSGRFHPGDPVSLLWEVYNLRPDSAGVARYTVDVKVTVKEIERHGFKATVFGMIGDAVGLTARGDDAVSLSYNRQANVKPGGRQVEYLTLKLDNAPNATYDVAVAITDVVANRVVISGTRRLTVTPTVLDPRVPQPGH